MIKTLSTIKLINDKYDYLADPHTATGLRVLLDKNEMNLGLASPYPSAKLNAIEQAIGKPPVLPEELLTLIKKKDDYIRK